MVTYALAIFNAVLNCLRVHACLCTIDMQIQVGVLALFVSYVCCW